MTIWTPSDYSNLATVSAAALCSILMVVFKSRCLKVSLCCGLWSCDRKLKEDTETDPIDPTTPPTTPSQTAAV